MIRLVFYAPYFGKSAYFYDLEKILDTLYSLVLLRVFNTICDGRVDYIYLKTVRSCSLGFKELLSGFQLTDLYRLEFQNIHFGHGQVVIVLSGDTLIGSLLLN